MTIKKGIDVSYHNGKINWEKVKNAGYNFAIIRAGYSTTVDTKFKENITGALNVGLDVGIYWFSYAIDDITLKKESEKCLSVLKPYKNKIKYPVFFDYEYDSLRYAKQKGVPINKNKVCNFTKIFLDNVKKEGYNLGVYTNIDFSKNYFNDDILNKYDVWIAQYNSTCSYKGKYTMWQHSEKGKINGLTGYFDLNYCFKDYVSHETNDNAKQLQEVLNKCYNAGLVVDCLLGSKTQNQLKIHYLKKVTINDHVRLIQTFLKQLGYKINIDGVYGLATENIIKKFQKEKGLKVDGYCGVGTHLAIIKALV